MGERKVLNKYYPPDFDPAKLPRARQPKNKQMNIRMMLPMSIRCNTCGNYIYKGTKFNSRKEDCEGEKYLGIQIFRFYFKCTRCSAELAMKTDPQNSDYTMESGASRNFEPWRAEDEHVDKEQRKRDAEEMGDAMKSLENRTLDSKREMDILAALDEMKSMKSRHANVSVDELLEALQRTNEKKMEKWEEEDEALIKSMVFPGSKDYIRRINDDDIDDDDDDDDEDAETSRENLKKRKVSEEASLDIVHSSTKASTTSETSKITAKVGHPLASNDNEIIIQSSSVRVSLVKRPVPASKLKKPDASKQTDEPNLEKSNEEKEEKASTITNTGLQSLLQNYESDEDD